MKRRTNIHLWPYVSIVIVNDIGEAQPVCKSVLMSEINESYVFLIQSALKMAPNVNILDIKVVFGDQFFTKELLQMSGLTEARLFYDHYHLILNQEKSLGPSLFNDVRPLLSALMNASSPEIFKRFKDVIIKKFPRYPELHLDQLSTLPYEAFFAIVEKNERRLFPMKTSNCCI